MHSQPLKATYFGAETPPATLALRSADFLLFFDLDFVFIGAAMILNLRKPCFS